MHSYGYFESDNKQSFTNRLHSLMALHTTITLKSRLFHGIISNLEFLNFDYHNSSMESHGTWYRSMEWQEQFPFMEFHGIWSVPISMKQTIPCNSMELHGTWTAPISTRAVPLNSWKSMELGVCQFRRHEQFHAITWNSMELRLHQFRWHDQFHGIPWNLFRHPKYKFISCMDLSEAWSMYNTHC